MRSWLWDVLELPFISSASACSICRWFPKDARGASVISGDADFTAAGERDKRLLLLLTMALLFEMIAAS